MSSNDIVIVAAKRTPMGAFQGVFSSIKATDLGSFVLSSILEEANVLPDSIDSVIMGCVLSAGLGQAPARQVALREKLPYKTNCLTLNKLCGSGLKSVMLACDAIKAESSSVVFAGGMESMTNAPYLSMKARQGFRIGHQEFLDHMMIDGLQDAMSGGGSMGLLAEKLAEKFDFSREAQDAFAIDSGKKALKAQEEKLFQTEICEVEFKGRKKTVKVRSDEPLEKINFEKIPLLSPAFKKEGTLTAANSSSIADGASAVLVMSEKEAEQKNISVLARVIAYAEYSREPEWFTLAPVGAIQKVLKKAKWSIDDVDLFEINEAFAVVAMACIEECGIPEEKVNIHGGACALGHPIGASGARLLVTLIHALRSHGKKKGIVSLCIGGGEAVAMAVEIN